MASEKKFLEFVAGVLEVPRDNLSLETAYGSIPAWDSVMQLRLTLEIGEAYGVEIPVDAIADIRTRGGFYRFVSQD